MFRFAHDIWPKSSLGKVIMCKERMQQEIINNKKATRRSLFYRNPDENYLA